MTTDVWTRILDGMHSAIPLSLPSKGMSKKIVAKSCRQIELQDDLVQVTHSLTMPSGLLKLALHPLQRHVPKELPTRMCRIACFLLKECFVFFMSLMLLCIYFIMMSGFFAMFILNQQKISPWRRTVKPAPEEMMSRTITRTLQEVLANSGLQINKAEWRGTVDCNC